MSTRLVVNCRVWF